MARRFLQFSIFLVQFLALHIHLYSLELPLGTRIEIRLNQGIDSYKAKAGMTLDATVVAPVLVGGKLAIPAGATLSGSLTSVQKVGIGLIHERARMELRFNWLQLPDGVGMPIHTRIFKIENAREKLDRAGRIIGIRSTNTPGYRAAGTLTSLAAVDPIALLFSSSAFGATLRFSDPEIHWERGAELILETERPLDLPERNPAQLPLLSTSPQEKRELQSLVERLPYRTTRVADSKPSDITNLILIANPKDLEAAFESAGWVRAEESTASSRYRSLRAFAETQPYQEAPMSELLLDAKPAFLTFSKTLNTFTRRHHIRIYSWEETWDGLRVFHAAATHDTDIIMNVRERTITHAIDERIDEERAKVINDLHFTGCLDAAEWVARPWVPKQLSNGTGQPILTDRSIAFLRLSQCHSPAPGAEKEKLDRGNAAVRTARQFFLRSRNDLIRGNLIWQTTSWAYRFSKLLRKSQPNPEIPYTRNVLIEKDSSPVNAAALEREDGSSMIAPALDTLPAARKPVLTIRQDWEKPTVELGFTIGTSLFCRSTVGEEAWLVTRHMTPQGPEMRTGLAASNQIRSGWAVGGTVTVHANRWISNEVGFHYQRGSFLLGLTHLRGSSNEKIPGIVEQRAGLLSRQFSYNTIAHLRPLESKFRPYIAIWPALQLVHLTDAPFRNSRGVFRIGLSNVGLLRSAYNFSSAPPLNGGGIFLPAMQFGGGFKYRYRKCWVLWLDFRSTVSHRPDLLKKSIASEFQEISPFPDAQTQTWFAQRRVSLGLSFTF